MVRIQTLRLLAGGLVLLCAALLSSCGPAPELSKTESFPFFEKKETIAYSKSNDGRVIPERVARFLAAAHSFGEGVRRYSLGTYQKTVTDCSGFLGQAHRSAGYGVMVYQFDYDMINFTSCTGGLKPGDVVLLAYPGRRPDHWIMMADVKDPQGKFHSPRNVIMDVSSDYVDGRPYFKGELARRSNLLARQVYACRRHRAFEKDWKTLAAQLKEQQRAGQDQPKGVDGDENSNPAQSETELNPEHADTNSTGGESVASASR
jgi:hypothetical protein